jgi:putative transposase
MRRSIRLQSYDYTSSGAYFVTICSHQRNHIFGEIQKDEMCLSEWGTIVQHVWLEIPTHQEHVQTDVFIVMPNHLHGILIFHNDTTTSRRDLPWQIPTEGNTPAFGYRVPGSLGSVIGLFKAAITKKINDLQNTHGLRVWQPNYYERVIRNDDELNAVRTYIENNPKNWHDDEENQ